MDYLIINFEEAASEQDNIYKNEPQNFTIRFTENDQEPGPRAYTCVNDV